MQAIRLSADVGDLVPETIRLRRHFHQHPELGYREEWTSREVAKYLTDLGLSVQTGIAKTGVVAVLEGARPGKTILLRADMDALPVEETNDVDYRSTCPGVMHACAHDGHMAVLLSTAKILAGRKDRLTGRVKFVFQPAEENPGGALPMIEEGVLENPRVDAALALHLAIMMPVGSVGVRSGYVFASTDEILVTVLGKGGHGAMPHETVDPIVCAARVVEAVQTLVSRECKPTTPLVVTFGRITGGHAFNVIPDRVELSGTVRTFDAELRKEMKDRIERVVSGTAAAAGAEYELEYTHQYPPLSNDPQMTELVRKVAADVVGPEHAVEQDTDLIGEDMAFFFERVPGCYFFVGARNPEKDCVYPHHSSRFNIDEDSLAIGVEIFVQSVEAYLANESNAGD